MRKQIVSLAVGLAMAGAFAVPAVAEESVEVLH